MRIAGWLVVAAWLTTICASWLLAGSWVGELAEGNDMALVSLAPLVVTSAAALVSALLTWLWARGPVRPDADAGAPVVQARRGFLLGAGATVGGLAATAAVTLLRNAGWLTVTAPNILVETPVREDATREGWRGARVREYRRLGRTGARVSDISLGSSRIRPEQNGEQIARLAIERGVNYFDTAPDYAETGSETALGLAMQGQRDDLFIATKFCTPQGNLPAGSSVSKYMEVVEGSLARLQTDHVDLVHIHSCDTLERLLDENVHEAFDRLKEQGKVRFLGVSSHTPNLPLVANAAIDSGRFDVLMLAYHHGAWPMLGEIIDKAAANDVGVVAMKTLKGAKHHGVLESRDEADSYTQGAFKWVLANPAVSCLVVSFAELGDVDEYLHASGQRPGPGDQAVLEKYDRLIAGTHCRQHCGVCLDSCPEQLQIDDVLRYRMYFEDYKDEKEAMRLYSRLDKQADVCISCSAPCLGTCPHGIHIQHRMTGAHQLLTLS